jgi:hypothetical protein
LKKSKKIKEKINKKFYYRRAMFQNWYVKRKWYKKFYGQILIDNS